MDRRPWWYVAVTIALTAGLIVRYLACSSVSKGGNPIYKIWKRREDQTDPVPDNATAATTSNVTNMSKASDD